MSRATNNYKVLLTEESLRKDLDDAKKTLDEYPEESYEISMYGNDDLNALDIKKWIETWKGQQVFSVWGNTLKYDVFTGDDDFTPTITLWYDEDEDDDAKSANSSTYGGGCRRICRFCKEECSCWNYNSDHEVVCEDCGGWCEEHEQVMYKDGMKCGGCMDDEDEKKINLTVGA